MRLGTRGSPLALAQAKLVAEALGRAEIVTVDMKPMPGEDKGRYVRGVEEALLARDVDLGVHSAKDVPSDRPPEIALVGVPEREDPRDAFVGAATSLAELPEGAMIGTSSLRRRSQLLALRGDLEVVEIRGNVDTRLRKLSEDDEIDAIVLAAAGLARLGREDEVSFLFELEEMTPSAGQGALALEARRGDTETAAAAAAISDHDALVELTAERAATVALEAGCDSPVGICARLTGERLTLYGYAGLADGSTWVRDRVSGDPEQPGALGDQLAARILAAGGREILR